jgi:hypothetical protein
MKDHWKPWVGEVYAESRLLLLGESAYSWTDPVRGIVHPSPQHSVQIIEEALSGELPRFTGMLTRALTGCYKPSEEEIAAAWATAAFINYVPGTVGLGRESRPDKAHWNRAREAFPGLLAELAPRTVIVLGKTMWSMMPDTEFYVTDLVQAYRLPNGGHAMCWAVDHPACGLSWEKLRRVIAYAHRGELMPWGV